MLLEECLGKNDRVVYGTEWTHRLHWLAAPNCRARYQLVTGIHVSACGANSKGYAADDHAVTCAIVSFHNGAYSQRGEQRG